MRVGREPTPYLCYKPTARGQMARRGRASANRAWLQMVLGLKVKTKMVGKLENRIVSDFGHIFNHRQMRSGVRWQRSPDQTKPQDAFEIFCWPGATRVWVRYCDNKIWTFDLKPPYKHTLLLDMIDKCGPQLVSRDGSWFRSLCIVHWGLQAGNCDGRG